MLGFGSAVIEAVGKRQSSSTWDARLAAIHLVSAEIITNSYALKHGKADDIDMDIDLRAADA